MKMYHLVEAESLWALSQKGAVNLPQVKTLQDRLRAAGFDPGASDGWYGKNTADAVKAYQQANGLTVDGDAGPQTLAKLGLAGANNTAPRETPPEETPPAPTPRDPIDGGIAPGTTAGGPSRLRQRQQQNPDVEPTTREPEVEPAPTAREPEPEVEPAPTRTEPETSTNNADSILQGIVDDDSKIKSYSLENNILTFVIDDSINQGYQNFKRAQGDGNWRDIDVEDALDYYGYNDNYKQSVNREIPNLEEIRFEVEGTENPGDPILQGQEGAAQLIAKFVATQVEPTMTAFDTFVENEATHMILKAKQSSVDPNVAIIVANRRSGKTDAELERLGIPRNGASIYAFDLSPGANVGNDLPKYRARNFNEIFEVFNTIDIEDGTYNLVRGSSRAKFKQLLKRYIAKEVSNESINRIANLAGL